MDDLEAYGRMFAVEMNGEAEAQSALRSLEEDIRVTLVHADGTVYYDNFADPNAMDNHADRPEIRQALENGSGSDIRNSSTVDQSAFYYAVRLKNGDVMRLAQEASIYGACISAPCRSSCCWRRAWPASACIWRTC